MNQFKPTWWEFEPDNRHSEPTFPDIEAVTAPRMRNLHPDVDFRHVTQRTREMQFLLDSEQFRQLLVKDYHQYDFNHMNEFWVNGDPQYGVNFNWRMRGDCTCFGCECYREMEERVDCTGGDYPEQMSRALAVTGISIILGKNIIWRENHNGK